MTKRSIVRTDRIDELVFSLLKINFSPQTDQDIFFSSHPFLLIFVFATNHNSATIHYFRLAKERKYFLLLYETHTEEKETRAERVRERERQRQKRASLFFFFFFFCFFIALVLHRSSHQANISCFLILNDSIDQYFIIGLLLASE